MLNNTNTHNNVYSAIITVILFGIVVSINGLLLAKAGMGDHVQIQLRMPPRSTQPSHLSVSKDK